MAITGFDLAKGNPVEYKFQGQAGSFQRLSIGYSDKPRHIAWRRIGNPAFGFAPENILAGGQEPTDFQSFWKKELAKAEKQCPLNVKLVQLQKESRPRFTVYRLSADTPQGKIYGFLSIPTKQKYKLPAEFTVMSAGAGAVRATTSVDRVRLVLNIHHFLPGDRKAYTELNAGTKKNTAFGTNYMYLGLPDREKLYFHDPIIAACRIVNYLAQRPEVDAKKIFYSGKSQGGGFGLILAGLTDKFQAVVVAVPALCDHSAIKVGRKPGWPAYSNTLPAVASKKEILKCVAYYDAAFFASYIRCPVYITIGLTDHICPPGSIYAAFNAIKAPKQIAIDPVRGHDARIGFNQARAKVMERLIRATIANEAEKR
jgi:cephalosporin-C deacetylase-like acetyl esterase